MSKIDWTKPIEYNKGYAPTAYIGRDGEFYVVKITSPNWTQKYWLFRENGTYRDAPVDSEPMIRNIPPEPVKHTGFLLITQHGRSHFVKTQADLDMIKRGAAKTGLAIKACVAVSVTEGEFR